MSVYPGYQKYVFYVVVFKKIVLQRNIFMAILDMIVGD
jgi:hypothetical protein